MEETHMKRSYNFKGDARKSLVVAISQILNTPTTYLGTPSFAYEVGPDYRIDKTGTVTGPDNHGLEDALKEMGFEAEASDYDSDSPQPCEVPQEAKLVAEPSEEPQETENPQDGDTAAQKETPATEDGILTIEVPLEGFTPEKLENLNKLVGAKAALIKAALGAVDLPVKRTPDTLQFPWFPADADAEHISAYTALVSQLCKTALQKTRVNAKAKDTEGSQKYAMRVFLLSIGMVGKEYSASRKALLSRLSGSSAFCSSASEERWKAKHSGQKAEASVEAITTPDEAGETAAE
jgi:hypothetical protein